MLVLLISEATCAVLTYFYVAGEDEDDYKAQVRDALSRRQCALRGFRMEDDTILGTDQELTILFVEW
jgi:hypothetical protein